MKTVVVVDTCWTGHIPTYHRALVETLLDLGCRVVSLSPKPVQVRWEISGRRKIENIFFGEVSEFEAASPPALGWPWNRLGDVKKLTPFSRAVAWWTRVRNAIEGIARETGWAPDLVVFPGIETNIISKLLHGRVVDRIFPYKWIGLYLTPKYLRKPYLKFAHKRIFRKDRFFEAKTCAAVAVLDEGVVPRLKRVLGAKKILVMPDFTSTEISSEETALAAHIVRRAAGRKIIGLYGELSKRKGITALIETARLAHKHALPWFFVFAGPLNRINNDEAGLLYLLEKIADAPGNCFFHLDRIPDEKDFNALFKMSDVIYASYEKFYHSSNLLTKAAFFRKPILVSTGYCMDERVRAYRLGAAVPEGDVERGLVAIHSLLNGKNTTGEELRPDYDGYLESHSERKLDEFLRVVLTL